MLYIYHTEAHGTHMCQWNRPSRTKGMFCRLLCATPNASANLDDDIDIRDTWIYVSDLDHQWTGYQIFFRKMH